MGLNKPKRSTLAITRAHVIRTAYHEAAHAVVGKHLSGERPQFVSIERGSENIDSPTSGFVRWGFHVPAGAIGSLASLDPALRRSLRAAAECWARMSLAGYAVEEVYGLRDADDPFDLFFAWDEEQDEDVVGAFEELRYFEKKEKKCWSWLDSLWAETKELVLRDNIKIAIGELAEGLLNTPTLAGDALSRHLSQVPFDISQMVRTRALRTKNARPTPRAKSQKSTARVR